MPRVNIKEQIDWLVKLQTVDTQIYRLQQEKENIPLKIKALEEGFARKKENLALLDKKNLELLRQRKDKELELAAKEEATKKLQAQLYQLKTNKEYSAKLKEIEDTKADASVLEDAILASLDEADKLKLEIDKEKQILAKEENNCNAEKQKLNLRTQEIEEKLAQLSAQRKQIIPNLESKIFSQYEKILRNRDYLAIVKVEADACRGCFMNVPPQVINLIKMYDDLVICEVCQRILYIEDEGIGDLH